jgi:SAM-dependent methyltransferase
MRYARMRWNAPLSDEHAALLIDRLELTDADSILDIGCGWGELLIRSVDSGAGDLTGVGVDTDAEVLARGRELAARRGLGDRVRFIYAPAQEWQETADRVLSVAASHAWGGSQKALAALTRLVRPGGRLLFGDGCWERPPTGAAWGVFGQEVLELAQIVAAARATGWRVLHLSTADLREWDEFESTWRAARQEWILAHSEHPEAEAEQAELDRRLAEYVGVYRGVLGFCYLVLARG